MRSGNKRAATRPERMNRNGSATEFARALARFEGRIVDSRMQRVVITVAKLVAVSHYPGSSRIKAALVEDRQSRTWHLSCDNGPVGLLRVCDVLPGNRFAVTTRVAGVVWAGGPDIAKDSRKKRAGIASD